MTIARHYIERGTTQQFAKKLAAALEHPTSYELLFYIYGIGGIGKSTFLDQIRQTCQQTAKGIILARAGRHQEGLICCEQALQLKEDETGHYGKACCYALQGQSELALEALQRAIAIALRRCRQEAKHNPDFGPLRQDPRFQALINPLGG